MFISITAFEKKDIVIAQVENIWSDDNVYFIHYNFRSFLKSPNQYIKLKKHFKDKKNVKIFTKYKVYWGHFSIIKSANKMMEIFIKNTNENIFMHIDQKTVNIGDIKNIKDYIETNIHLGYNFFNFNKSFLNKIEKDNTKGHLISRENFPLLYTSKKFYKNTIYQNSKLYKLFFLFHILKDIFYNPRIINFKSINGTLNNWKKYKGYFDKTNISSILSNKNYKLPKLIQDWNFSFYNNIGPFVILSRDEATSISKLKINKNYKKVKKFYNFSKNKYLPEDFYFSTLFWNIVSDDKRKSKNIMSYYDINNEEDVKFYFNNLYEEEIFFLRRCMGYKNINLINKYKKEIKT